VGYRGCALVPKATAWLVQTRLVNRSHLPRSDGRVTLRLLTRRVSHVSSDLAMMSGEQSLMRAVSCEEDLSPKPGKLFRMADVSSDETEMATITSTAEVIFYCHAMPSPPRNLSIRPCWTRDSTSLSSVQSLYVVELKLSLCTCLARQTHARRMPNP
jgi:hypothetical protein